MSAPARAPAPAPAMVDAAKLEQAVARLTQGIFKQGIFKGGTDHWERFTTKTGIAIADDIPDFVNAEQRDMLRHMLELRPAPTPAPYPKSMTAHTKAFIDKFIEAGTKHLLIDAMPEWFQDF
eukprot:SAG11_NODE_316_length_10846_cov_8.188239_5_plen_122_part_00